MPLAESGAVAERGQPVIGHWVSDYLVEQRPQGGPAGAGGLVIDAAKFRAVFTADLPQLQSDVLGRSRRERFGRTIAFDPPVLHR